MTWQRSLTISGGTIRREDMGIFVYNVADSKYEEVDVRRCKWHV